MEFKEKVFRAVSSSRYNGIKVDMVINMLAKQLKAPTQSIVDALDDLCTEGRVDIAEDDTIALSLQTGTFKGNKNGGTYIETIDGKKIKVDSLDRYLLLLHGDKIRYTTFNNNGESEAVVNGLIGRANMSLIGQIVKLPLSDNPQDYSVGFIPQDRRYGKIIPLKQNARAYSLIDHKCTINLQYSDDKFTFEGVVDKDFGPAGDPIVENQVIAHSHGFKKEFPKLVQMESLLIPTEVLPHEYEGRLDLRHLPFVTIDPENCKDMDDAVCCEQTESGYTLYVAIADVSHYVKPGSEIDREAYKRGTSAYLGDGVYPMLPPVLSENICSLKPNEDRLALIYTIHLDHAGKLIDYSLDKGVINSKYKLSYPVAQKIHEEKEYEHIKKGDIKHNIDLLYEVTDKLKANRKENYPIDLDSHEPTFMFDETKTSVLKVMDTSDQTAKSVIEESMLIANHVAGQFAKKNGLGMLYRVHEIPSDERLAGYQMVLDDLGVDYIVANNNLTISDLADKISTHPLSKYLTSRLLRTFPKAHYASLDIGHFGLNMENYTHSTSPIRRYPDLLLHRAISDHFENPGFRRYSKDELDQMGGDLSLREKEADYASRESNSLLEALYATPLIGSVVEATVYDVLPDALVLTIKNDQNLDMIPVTLPYKDLGGNFICNMSHTKCRSSLDDGRAYMIGDKLKVKISNTSIDDRKILVVPSGKAHLRSQGQKDSSHLSFND